MVNAIKYDKDIHKLTNNEMKMYHELQKFLNKEQQINVVLDHIYLVIILKNYVIKFLQHYIINLKMELLINKNIQNL